MMKVRSIIVLSLACLQLTLTSAQCLQSGGIGDFEMGNLTDDWFNQTQGNGTFTLDGTDSQSGTQSLRVDVSMASPWQVRILNESCTFEFTNGINDTVQLYLKGTIGSEVDVALMDNWTSVTTQTITLTSANWQLYEVVLTPNISSTQGKVKISFKDVGTYYLDNVVLLDTQLPASSTAWYVSGGSGADNMTGNNGRTPSAPLNSLNYAVKTAWQPGDTIYVMDGVYRNSGYGDYASSGGSSGLNNNSIISVYDTDISTNENQWLVITNYPGHSPKLEFDGSGGIIMHRVSYVDISGLEIEGPNQQITKSEALANRLIHDNYFSGRGIAIWGGTGYPHHINIHHMNVHDCPNSGIRVNDGDYVNLSHNEVYNCTWWSSNAESAIVIAQSKDFDTKDTIKMVMSYNNIHDNRNFIPFYCCDPTGPLASNPSYGTSSQDYIHDGQGVYITRNNAGSPNQAGPDYQYGWFYFANNVTYNNGINGLVVHKSDRAIVTNNLAFMNGATSPDPVASGGEGRQNAGGITINESDDVYMYNNISWVRYPNDYSYQIYGGSVYTASNNIGINGSSAFGPGEYTDLDATTAAQMFLDTASHDFNLVAGAFAIDAGIDHANMPPTDFTGNPHVGTPDIGPFEYQGATASGDVPLTDPNICVEGIVESEITGSNELRTFRFLKDYATTSVSGYYSSVRAASSAGVVIKIKTSSPTVDISFSEDLTWADDVFWHRISVYKDDVFQYNTNDFDLNLTNSGGSSVEWKFVLPVYTQMNLKSIQLASGYSLDPISDCNTKPVYIAIGNSITMGVGTTQNDSRFSYSRLVADSEDYELYNWGIGGSKVYDEIIENLNSGVNPSLITVLWGYNDTHYSGSDSYFTDQTFPRYEALLDTLCRRFPAAKVMAILPTFTTNPTNTAVRNIPNLSAGQLSIIQNLQATYSNLCYIDGQNYTDASGLNDDVHLNDNGNASLAAGIIANLNSCGSTPVDCNGDAGGTATIDGCGVCAGGNTGMIAGASCSPDQLVLRSEFEVATDIITDLEFANEGSGTYTILGGNENNYYSIDGSTGEISINATITDVMGSVHYDSLEVECNGEQETIVVVDAYDYYISTHPEFIVLDQHQQTDSIAGNPYTAYNNLWGKGTATENVDFRMATLVHPDFEDSTVFIWDTPSKADVYGGASVWSYINLIYGNRKGQREDLAGFPFQIGELTTLDYEFDFEKLFGTETYKIALNQFMTDESGIEPFSANDGDFFMVFDQVGTWVPPYPVDLGDTIIDGKAFARLYDTDGNYEWRRVIIRDNEQLLSGTLSILELYNQFISQGYIDPNQYVPNIQVGIEVTEGWGAVRFNKSHFTINTSPMDCNGDAGGTAAIDNCSVCSGGNTGIAIDDCLTSINKSQISQSINIYPVPVENMLHIESSNEIKYWDLINQLGEVVLNGIESDIDVRNLASGVYFLRINSQVFEVIKQ